MTPPVAGILARQIGWKRNGATVGLPITLVVGGRPENCGSSQEVRLAYAAKGHSFSLVSQWVGWEDE